MKPSALSDQWSATNQGAGAQMARGCQQIVVPTNRIMEVEYA